MTKMIKSLLKKTSVISPLLDLVFSPLVILIGLYFRFMKFIGVKTFPFSKQIFHTIGFFPLVNHYYEPQFDFRSYRNTVRDLKAIDFNENLQLDLLRKFNYGNELINKPREKATLPNYYYNNGSFSSGDAECYYSLIRLFQPERIIEVGSGYSTLIAREALLENNNVPLTDSLTCIEPYEMEWLEKLEVNLIRKKVEDVELEVFSTLRENDILFIDSSHVIRPNGDVTFEILNLLPTLAKGVLVHFHDILTPFNYPEDWLKNEYRLWTEQYLFEAFMSYNSQFEIVLALNYLHWKHSDKLKEVFPIYAKDEKKCLGSFWIRKI